MTPHSPAAEAAMMEVVDSISPLPADSTDFAKIVVDSYRAMALRAIDAALKDPTILAAIWPSEPTEGMLSIDAPPEHLLHEPIIWGYRRGIYKAMRDAWVAGRE